MTEQPEPELQETDGRIRLRLPKGTILVLTVDEYRRAVKRGKAEYRARQQAAREEADHAKHEAKRLDWIE